MIFGIVVNAASFLRMMLKIKSDNEEKVIDKNENTSKQVTKGNTPNKSHK